MKKKPVCLERTGTGKDSIKQQGKRVCLVCCYQEEYDAAIFFVATTRGVKFQEGIVCPAWLWSQTYPLASGKQGTMIDSATK